VYDVCVPAGYTVSRLIQADLLAPLDRAKLPNFANLEKSFLDAPWDSGNRFTVPYQWGMTGIAYRSDKVEVPPQDLSVFFDARYQRKMTMMDDAREVLGAMLKKRGESQNSRDAAKLEIAKQDAIVAKRNLRAFLSAPVKAQLIAGEVWVAQLWNGDTAQAKSEQSAIDWVLPKEGSNLWSDSLVIPRAAKHKNAAHAFIDYVLRADVGAAISRLTGYGTPNRAAHEKLGAGAVQFPAEAERARLEYQVDLGRDQALWDRFWTEVKVAE
jgi:spermidine/putrescine transport system substrate-binding protein